MMTRILSTSSKTNTCKARKLSHRTWMKACFSRMLLRMIMSRMAWWTSRWSTGGSLLTMYFQICMISRGLRTSSSSPISPTPALTKASKKRSHQPRTQASNRQTCSTAKKAKATFHCCRRRKFSENRRPRRWRTTAPRAKAASCWAATHRIRASNRTIWRWAWSWPMSSPSNKIL